ncbi:interferon-induced, double-stranded RNA-activated protein kinase isoform X1 [Pangasianodon hypophthalmus]|uniref:interferon-induced, double-stranded RNA-activated protein kinase isoform X1 n=1 Tax=Pangasianodon hypophthalmus TaxID=310915 RepID=UPI0023081F74|nr:interferon-induced, double-stranded RNA-activated protein kinase isoform X1 [Pangasianodon hypophthalmus]XP_026795318.3 interferon-induced, double-stranded RNA-activated protein kinase isoform X1 [Pangasianodon hypophthalmus]
MDPGQKNYVGFLNEYAQKRGWSVRFDLVQTAGPEHIKTFTMRAVMNNKIYPDGVGQNKKEAKQNAAKNALNFLENDDSVNTETHLSSSARASPVTQANYICWLNEYSHKKRLTFNPKETTKMSSGSNIQVCSYACKYVCGDKEFPEATSNSKKEAKEAAAKLVYEILTEQEQEQVLDENRKEENLNIQNLSTSLHHLKLSTPADTENTTAEKNFIGLLNEYCQKSKQVPDFKAVDRRGPAHDPEFVYKVVINKKQYPEGRGRTAKEAKQKAAQLAWFELCGSDLSSQISSPSSMSESTDDVSSSQKTPKNHSQSESVIFANLSSTPEPQPLDVKPKRQLAAKFQNSPVSNKKEQSNINVLKVAKPSTKSTTVSNHSTKSRFLEEFDSITKIGKGGFGRVFKARRKLEDTNYAVKIVKFNEKARREVSALSRLVHANIVRYHTSWTEETAYRDDASETCSTSSSGSGSEFLYIQMEFCEGETLCQWIEERNSHPKKYPERRQEAAAIIKQVLEAVKYVHVKKLFHRDLKPANIMFGHDGGVKVGDFGLVTKEEGDDDGSLLERTKRVGTRSYMSPEQGQQVYGRKVDIYAVGLIYFELLWCFGTHTEKQKLWDDIRNKTFPEEFSKMFDFEHTLIDRMLCENPKGRPEARDLLTELDQHTAATACTEHNVQKVNRTY